MPNERLRGAIASAGTTVEDLAAQVGVDPKTVERWIGQSRRPHRAHRWDVARLLGSDEAYLWPPAADDLQAAAASRAEFLGYYPHRGALPAELVRSLTEQSKERIDVLVYAGLFLSDGLPDLPRLLGSKAQQGVQVRLMLGDPDSEAVELRGREEGIGEGLAARVRLSQVYLGPAVADGAQLRLHATTLYNSVFRFDDELLVNTHVFGAPAAQSPVMHLRQVPGGRLFSHYLEGLERVWDSAASPTDAAAGSADGPRGLPR